MAENVRRSKFVEGLVDFVGGSLGGVATVYVGQPLDTVKVKMQTFPKVYNGMLDCFIKTYRSEGFVRGLYAGTGPAITANVAENSVLFACYGVCQKFIARVTNTPDVSQLGTLSNATAGSLASFFSAFSLCPTELIKVKLQCAREVGTVSGNKIEITASQLVREIIRRNGFFGLFQGLQSTIAREMPGYFVFFGAYEGCRELLKPAGKTKEDCSTFATFVSGAASGIALWSVIYPIDVVKSRIQVTHEAGKGNLFVHLLNISRKEGVMVLYSGLQPTLIRTIPATAALFLTYEWTKKILSEIIPY